MPQRNWHNEKAICQKLQEMTYIKYKTHIQKRLTFFFFLKSLDSSLKLPSSLIWAYHTLTLDFNKITKGDKILLKCFSWRTEVPIFTTALKLQHVCIAEKKQPLRTASLWFLCHASVELWNLVCKGLCHPLSIRNFTKGWWPLTILWIACC